jgi:ParB-like chromosome segregation protein Spo0J
VKPNSWPADKIERWLVAKLIPYARNARKHGPSQIAELADLIREFGWTIPVLVDENGEIIAGHGRVLAAQLLELKEVPVIVARGWTAAQKRAYRLADNEVASHSTWNRELLRVELADLAAQAVDLTTLGFKTADAAADNSTVGELPQALQLEPAREYAVIMCADLDEWERLKVALNLKPVRRGGYKKGSPFDDIGTQRVVAARDILRKLTGSREEAA